ncbi:Exonuclease 1 [Vigna angularis]|uniref:Exonuclease 1 n=1 Tax=Phaseolus angularis TaxID=3914 RepID=A0A8T0JZT2_PHAAN|nr:Exonuclease 1 [Vigna angularis]
MGIKDLLRFMKPYIETFHIHKYAGKRVGIDAYSWLHKGAYSCSMDLCLDSDSVRKLRYIEYFMHRVNLLRFYKITPVVVFDGGNAPCKAATEEERNRHLKEGNVAAASELFQTLKSEKIEFVVAPYEADAQLAYMSHLGIENGGVAAVITEDSDLIAYGCMCVLAGCDFLPSVPGIGIARAHALVSKYRNLDRILSVLKLEKGDQMPEDYAKTFRESVAVFQYARIYDTNAKELKHMKPLPQNFIESHDGNLDFLGPEIPPSIVKAIAEGNLNPSTKKAFDKSESSRFPLHPNDLQSLDQVQKAEVPTPSRPKNSFSIIASQYTRENSTGKRKLWILTRLLDEEKYSNEFLDLRKLIMPLGTIRTEEKTTVSDNTPLKVPDNNPFRVRRNEERYQTKDNVENISVASSLEYTDLCMSPDNFQEEGSDGNLLKKRKIQNTLSDKAEATCEPVSVVTEAEKSDVVCLTVESPESVTSETKIIADLKGRSESKKKSNRRSNSKKTGSNNNRTLLHFFSRV